ncbi:hypothetical protein D6821_00335 [Candidatus Parcubacteria bacterium]|nr:MAG: hypothetical protein D6821_00335 [Candidatus Parcubacteria bacterium]
MLNTKFFNWLKQKHFSWENERRQIISRSNDILHTSKRVIFALHRDDRERALLLLKGAEKSLQALQKKFGSKRLEMEGAYKAALEEFVEAAMFWRVIEGKKLNRLSGLQISYDSYLAGISDLTGEIMRRIINKAARRQTVEVERLIQLLQTIMTQLVEFDMTGYLRTKYDQARSSLRKAEQIYYELKIRE